MASATAFAISKMIYAAVGGGALRYARNDLVQAARRNRKSYRGCNKPIVERKTAVSLPAGTITSVMETKT